METEGDLVTLLRTVIPGPRPGDRAAPPGFGGLDEVTFLVPDWLRIAVRGFLRIMGDAGSRRALRDLLRASSLTRLDLPSDRDLLCDLGLDSRSESFSGPSYCFFSWAPAKGAARLVPSHCAW